MIASNWLDLVVGVDMHFELVPPAMVPVWIPNPYVGLTGDPLGMVIGALTSAALSAVTQGVIPMPKGPVLINGLPATTTDEIARNTLIFPHFPIPPGVSYVKPPSGETKFLLGGQQITFNDANPVRLGEFSFSCSDPLPLPTSRVITIPKGPPVLIPVPAGMNVERIVVGWLIGKAVRVFVKAAARVAGKLFNLGATRLRNLWPKVKCFFTGHPVDVATGRVMTEARDFELPGPLPLVFERNYSSAWAGRDGPLGPGWSHSLDQAV